MWNSCTKFGFQMISTSLGFKVSIIIQSVKCPFPVAAKLPQSSTIKWSAFGNFSKTVIAAFAGPIVWELEGPRPILYNSLIVSIILIFFLSGKNFALKKIPKGITRGLKCDGIYRSIQIFFLFDFVLRKFHNLHIL